MVVTLLGQKVKTWIFRLLVGAPLTYFSNFFYTSLSVQIRVTVCRETFPFNQITHTRHS